MRELGNTLSELDAAEPGTAWVLRNGIETLSQLIAPMTPHIAEEIWLALGNNVLLADTPWPEADPALLTDQTVTVAVQVNGKLRCTLELARDSGQKAAEAAALAEPSVARAVGDRSIRRIVVVPNKIVNVVV